jgi:hypothetical protein
VSLSRGSRRWHLLLVVCLVLVGVSGVPASAQSGSVTSAAVPSNSTPSVGQQIEVTITIDVSDVDPPDDALGSYTATLDWDPAVLAYKSDTGVPAGFAGIVNTTGAASGHIIFNGANAAGVTGNFTALRITFDVVGAGSSDLDLNYTAMAAAATFKSLLSILTVTDGRVDVQGDESWSIFLPMVLRGAPG